MLSAFHRTFGFEVPLSQAEPLTTNEARGSLAADYGLLPSRRSQVPRDWPSPLVRFMSPATPAPRPSARRPAPQRNAPGHSASGVSA